VCLQNIPHEPQQTAALWVENAGRRGWDFPNFANFQQRRLQVFKISVLLINSPEFTATSSILEKKF